jgi:glutathione peroxidase
MGSIGLEDLNKAYAPHGLVILGFPCDQFAHQEPGNDAEIAQFCALNFGVTFPLMAKIEVNGRNAHPLFRQLRKKTGGLLGDSIKWNFTKFLVSADGQNVERFGPTVEPKSLEKLIRQRLGLDNA